MKNPEDTINIFLVIRHNSIKKIMELWNKRAEVKKIGTMPLPISDAADINNILFWGLDFKGTQIDHRKLEIFFDKYSIKIGHDEDSEVYEFFTYPYLTETKWLKLSEFVAANNLTCDPSDTLLSNIDLNDFQF